METDATQTFGRGFKLWVWALGVGVWALVLVWAWAQRAWTWAWRGCEEFGRWRGCGRGEFGHWRGRGVGIGCGRLGLGVSVESLGVGVGVERGQCLDMGVGAITHIPSQKVVINDGSESRPLLTENSHRHKTSTMQMKLSLSLSFFLPLFLSQLNRGRHARPIPRRQQLPIVPINALHLHPIIGRC